MLLLLYIAGIWIIPTGNLQLAICWTLALQCCYAPTFACCINFAILVTYPLPAATANGAMVASSFIFSSLLSLGGSKVFESSWIVGFYILIGAFAIATLASWLMRNPQQKPGTALSEGEEDEDQELDNKNLIERDS